MVFRDGANELSKRENLKWADTIAYYNPVTPNGPKRLVGWDYTPQGGTKTTWTGAPNPIALATIAGNAAVAAGSTFYLDAVYEDNATWTINYNKVNVDAAGNPISTSVTKVGTEDGYIEPGNAIDIHSFNGKNYIKTFNDANAATTLLLTISSVRSAMTSISVQSCSSMQKPSNRQPPKYRPNTQLPVFTACD